MKDRLARKLKGLKYPSIHEACLLNPQNTGAETTGTKKQDENIFKTQKINYSHSCFSFSFIFISFIKQILIITFAIL